MTALLRNFPPQPRVLTPPHAPQFPGHCRGSAAVRTRAVGLWRRPVQSHRPARRHRAVARRQDRVHHRADPRADARRPLSGVRGLRLGADCAGAARAAARRCGAAVRLREPCQDAGRGAALAELDHRYQRAAPRDRLSAPQRRRPQPHARHRRLSRRVAAGPAAAQQKFRAMVGGESGAVARTAAGKTGKALARSSRRA